MNRRAIVWFLASLGMVGFVVSAAPSAEPASQQEFRQGVAYFEAAEYASALATLKPLTSGLKSDPEFHYYYGLGLLKTDQPQPAIEALERAIDLEPRNADYRFALGLAYAARMSELSLLRAALIMGEAKQAMVSAVELDPQHAGAAMALAELLLDVPAAMGGDRKKARELLITLRTLDPASAAALEARMEWDNPERVEKLLLRAVETQGSDAVFRLRLTRFYVDQQAYAKAIRYGREYLDQPKRWSDVSSDTTFAHLWLAVAYHGLGDAVTSRFHLQAVEAARLPPRLRQEAERVCKETGFKHQGHSPCAP